MRYLEARIKGLCSRISVCKDDAEAEEVARELHVLLHEFLENARNNLIVIPPLLSKDHEVIMSKKKAA